MTCNATLLVLVAARPTADFSVATMYSASPTLAGPIDVNEEFAAAASSWEALNVMLLVACMTDKQPNGSQCCAVLTADRSYVVSYAAQCIANDKTCTCGALCQQPPESPVPCVNLGHTLQAHKPVASQPLLVKTGALLPTMRGAEPMAQG